MENVISSAKELSAMDLNNIKLDSRHTVLTPQYLEDIIRNNSAQPSQQPNGESVGNK